MAALTSLLGTAMTTELPDLPLLSKVPVVLLVTMTSKIECGAHVLQQQRSNPSFLGAPWYDAVLYRVGSGDVTSVNGEAKGSCSKRAPTEGSFVETEVG